MKQWAGNAHGDQRVRCLWEKRVGRFDFRGGQKAARTNPHAEAYD